LSSLGSDQGAEVIRRLPSPAEALPFDGAAALTRLTVLALGKLRAILSLPLPRLDGGNEHLESAMELAKVQLAAAECVLRVQTRVDRNRLKRQEIDRLPQLLQIIEEEKRLIAEARTIDASPHKPR
jgi:hypothetical protein